METSSDIMEILGGPDVTREEYDGLVRDGDIIICQDSDEPCYAEHCVYVEEFGYVYEENMCGFVWVEHLSQYWEEDKVSYSEINEEYVHDNYLTDTYCGTYLLQGTECDNDFFYVEYGCASDQYVYCDDTMYCEDIGSDVHESDAHYCDADDCYYYNPDEMPGSSSRDTEDHINEYHHSPSPMDLSRGSQFRIGFEIEKDDFDGNTDEGEYVGSFSLFKGFETDSSCGVEALTHILPLSPLRSSKRKEMFAFMDGASDIINADCEGKRTNGVHNCGGHIVLSWKDNPHKKLFNAIRLNLSVVMALYRYRMKNTYCNGNKSLLIDWNGSYPMVRLKPRFNAVEIRLPSRVQNVKQLKLRYDLMYIILDHSINKKDKTFIDLLNKLNPTLNKMYDYDHDRVEYIKRLAHDFREYLLTGSVSDDISEFINETNEED